MRAIPTMVALAITVVSGAAHANTCITPPKNSPRDVAVRLYRLADSIALVKVVRVTPGTDHGVGRADIEVLEKLKGDPPTNIVYERPGRLGVSLKLTSGETRVLAMNGADAHGCTNYSAGANQSDVVAELRALRDRKNGAP